MAAKPRRNRATAARSAGGEAPRHSTATEQPDPEETAPPASASPPASPKPASDPSSNVVDGRRIRTSL
jgi:hypothetical protein